MNNIGFWEGLSWVGSGLKNHPFQVIHTVMTAGIMWKQFRASNSSNSPVDVEMTTVKKHNFTQSNRKIKPPTTYQSPRELPRTTEVETTTWKKRIKNVVIALQVLGALAFFALCMPAVAGIVGGAPFSVPILISVGVYLLYNAYLTRGLAKHFRMHEYTVNTPQTVDNMDINLNVPMYRSNANNTFRFLCASLIPLAAPIVSFSLKIDKWEEEANKLAAEARNN
jgi:hypothetical protein